MERKVAKNIDEYISWFPEETKQLLSEIRKIIIKVAPEAKETISYNIPAYQLHGMLVYFAGFKKHVSLYPAPPRDHEQFTILKEYKGGKGTVQFPINQPLPVALIEKIVQFRKEENLKKQK